MKRERKREKRGRVVEFGLGCCVNARARPRQLVRMGVPSSTGALLVVDF